ncbi:MAG: YbjN domain-containing protein [Allosphingosinicella sp.]|uniref:YbjN domain-containing protein n=1 Tax=Allosphingosinicella sp. TaxID=2823234 RepID=UPI0039339161
MRAAVIALFFLTPAAAAAQVAPPQWNPRAPENNQLLPSFNFATVEPVLTAIGARHQRAGTPDRPALNVIFPNNRRAVIAFGNCERGGSVCKALSIQSIWNLPAGVPPERAAQGIQNFNHRYAFSKAFQTNDGRPALQRYLTADYGFVRGNLAVNLLVFANQAERFAAEVMRPLEQPARR